MDGNINFYLVKSEGIFLWCRRCPQWGYSLHEILACFSTMFLVFPLQMAHPKLGSFDGDVILPVKLFKSRGKVSSLYEFCTWCDDPVVM